MVVVRQAVAKARPERAATLEAGAQELAEEKAARKNACLRKPEPRAAPKAEPVQVEAVVETESARRAQAVVVAKVRAKAQAKVLQVRAADAAVLKVELAVPVAQRAAAVVVVERRVVLKAPVRAAPKVAVVKAEAARKAERPEEAEAVLAAQRAAASPAAQRVAEARRAPLEAPGCSPLRPLPSVVGPQSSATLSEV